MIYEAHQTDKKYEAKKVLVAALIIFVFMFIGIIMIFDGLNSSNRYYYFGGIIVVVITSLGVLIGLYNHLSVMPRIRKYVWARGMLTQGKIIKIRGLDTPINKQYGNDTIFARYAFFDSTGAEQISKECGVSRKTLIEKNIREGSGLTVLYAENSPKLNIGLLDSIESYELLKKNKNIKELHDDRIN